MIETFALNPLFQIKIVDIWKTHEMPITSENKYFTVEKVASMSISCTGFLSDDITIWFIVCYLSMKDFSAGLLLTDEFKCFHHWLGDGGELPSGGDDGFFAELFEELVFSFKELFLFVLFDDSFHTVIDVYDFLGVWSEEWDFVRRFDWLFFRW